MTFISKILSFKKPKIGPDLQFGRFCDGFKTQEQIAYWDAAVTSFFKEKYIESFENLLGYILDPGTSNVQWTKANGKIHFTLYQGSKIITGEVSAIHCYIHSVIAAYKKTDVRWLRILLEENYNSTYTRFAVNTNQEITIVFDNYMEEAVPQKLLDALRELSIRADKIDDIFLSDFSNLKPAQNDHVIQLPDFIKSAKYRFYRKKVDEVMDYIQHPPPHLFTFKGGYIYMILACGYSLDYLVKPEGRLMKCIENCHQGYFNEEPEELDIKTKKLIQNFQEIINIKEEELFLELYDTRSTFGQDLPVGTQGLFEIIEAQWADLTWFLENQYLVMHRHLSDYVVGFSLFSLCLPLPYKRLLHLYYEITENDYFKELGYTRQFVRDQIPIKKEIIQAIQEIKNLPTSKEINLQLDLSSLHFDDLTVFSHQFLFMVKQSIDRPS